MNRAGLVGLVDAAPGPLRTLRATLRHWTHPGRSQRAIERFNQGGATRVAGVTMVTAQFGEFDPAEPIEQRSQAWYEVPGRWCEVVEGTVDRLDLSDGVRHWTGTAQGLTERATPPGLGPSAWLLAPGPLLGPYALVDPADDAVGGRPCVRASATPRAGDAAASALGATRMLQGGMVAVGMVGVDHRYWFDAAYGVVLRHEASVDGEPSSVTELLDVVVDEPIDPARFRPPPGAHVRSEWEERMSLLEQVGIDTAGIAEGDVAAADAALTGPARPPDLATLVARHVPVGPPPADPAGAEAAIRAALDAVGEVDATGRDLVNVQAGHRLAPLMERASQRLPRATRENTHWAVDALRFLDATHAAVWFTIVAGGAPTIIRQHAGRAVCVDGRWLIEHATVVQLLEMAGVRVPAPDAR